MRYFILFLIIILITSCSSDNDSQNEQLDNRIKLLKFNPETQVQLSQSSEMPGQLAAHVIYPYKDFNPASGTAFMSNFFARQLPAYFSSVQGVYNVEIEIREDTPNGKLIGTLRINRDEMGELNKNPGTINKMLQSYIELDSEYMVEMKLLTLAKNADKVKISREKGPDDENIIRIELVLDREKIENVPINVLQNHEMFEEMVASTVRTTFETDDNIDYVVLYISLNKEDPRWPGTEFANYTLDRESFEAIVAKWDDLRYKIFEDIVYEPIFLADFIAESTVTNFTGNDSMLINLYYDEKFKDIDDTVGLVTADAKNLIVRLFDSYPDTDEIELHFKAKVPAREGEVSSDGVHSIISDFLVVRADRYTYEDLQSDELTPMQFLYNFDMVWDDRGPDLVIRDNMWINTGYFRSIEFSDEQREAEIVLDSCLFTKDKMISGDIKTVRNAISRGNYDESVEDVVYNSLFDASRSLVFDHHPPFLETVTITIERVYRDTTGNEIDVTELGTVSFEKEADANYWFQTIDPDDLEWIFETEDSLDIDDDEVLCQT